MHTKLPNISFLQKLIIFCLIFEEFKKEFLNQGFSHYLPRQAWSKSLFDFSKSCPSRHQGFQKISKWKKVFVKTNWLLTMITNHFEIPVVQNLKIFSFFLSHWIYSFFRSISKIHDDKNIWNISSFISRIRWYQAMFTYFKSVYEHSWSKRQTSWSKTQTKISPNWSFILMLLVTTDQFYEFDRICVDQGLDLVLKGRAIFYGMPSNSSVVLTSGINIVYFQIWRSSWSCRNDRNPIVMDQYGEQFSIRHRKCMVHFDPFPFLALVIA